MVRILEARDRDDRAEHFAPHDLVALLRAGDHGGLVEEAATAARLAAGRHLDVPLTRGAVDEAGDARALLGADQRPHLHARRMLPPRLDAAGGGGEVGDQLVVYLRAGVYAARGRAVLAGVVEAKGAHAADHRLDVGVVEDDDRRLAAELEVRALVPPLARPRIFSPVATSPVSEIIATCGCATSGAPTVWPRPATTLTTPGGNSSASSVASFSAVSGVCSAGLSTQVLPAASAGASFHAAIISG